MARFPRTPIHWSQSWKFYSREVVRQLKDKNIALWAEAIAFKVLITVVPVLVVVMLLIVNRSQSYDAFTGLVREFIPAYRADLLLDFVGEFRNAAGTLTLLASIGLAVTSVTLMTTLRTVLSNLFVEKWHDRRGFWQGYAFDIVMSVCFGAFLVATISVSAFVQTMHLTTSGLLLFLGLDYTWIRDGWTSLLAVAGYLLPILLSTAMFYLLYFATPSPRPPAKSVLIGATVAGLLFEVAKHIFTLFAVRVGGPGILSILGDTLGLIIGFVLWAYYSGIVLIIGALVVVLHEKRHRTLVTRSSRLDGD